MFKAMHTCKWQSQDLDLFPLIPIQFFKTMQTENNFLNEHSARAMCLEGLLSWPMHQGFK